MVEVCYRSGYREVHGAEFPHQALQLLLAHPTLCGRDGEKLEELQICSFWEGNRSRPHVDQPPQNLFFAGPAPSPAISFLTLTESLVFPGKDRKSNLLPGPCR